MIDQRYKLMYCILFELVFNIAIGVCGCSQSRSRNVDYSQSDGGETVADANDSETESRRSIEQILSDRVVTPDEISIEILKAFFDQPLKWEQPPKLESDSCGYRMTLVDTSENPNDRPFSQLSRSEVRLFDSAGRLRGRRYDLFDLVEWGSSFREREETEIIYDQEGRPLTIWDKETFGDIASQSAVIIAVSYNEDGSAFSKAIFGGIDYPNHWRDHTIDWFVFQSFVFDSNNRLIEHVRSLDRNYENVRKLEMTYREDGKPLSYRCGDPDNMLDEIVWEYRDSGREVIAIWDDLNDVDSTLYFDFDLSDKLISILVDYRNDGQIDETTTFEYNEQGNLVRVATDLDRDGIEDLLRLNSYDESGLLLTEELHNLGGNTVRIYSGDFSYVTTSTVRKTTYSYDSESRLIERVVEGSPRPAIYETDKSSYRYDDFYETDKSSYRYDDLGRFVELQVIDDRYYQESGESFFESDKTKCQFDYSCDTIPDQTSELHRCDLSISEVYRYLFPFNAASEMPFHDNLLPEDDDIDSIEPEDVLGIPWY